MFNFLTLNLKLQDQNTANTNLLLGMHLPRLFFLYKKYEKLLHDDYTPPVNFKKFLDFVLGNNFFWLITESETNKFAGFVYLDNITGDGKRFHSAEITTCFERNFWGEKTRQCAMEFFEYVFEKFGFYKIKAEIYPQNFRVKTLLKKCGFIKECTLKNETLREGKLQNLEIYALINKKKCEEQ